MPQNIGNKKLKTLYECQSCNEIFGKYERDLALYLRVINSSGSIHRKKGSGITKYSTNTSSISTEKVSGKVRIASNDPDSIKIEGNAIETNFLSEEAFLKLNVYKSLLKMAISTMPYHYNLQFDREKKFLLYDEEYPLDLQWCLAYIHDDYVNLKILGFLRSTDRRELPYYVFLIQFGQLSLQIDLTNEKYNDQKINHVDLYELMPNKPLLCNLGSTEPTHQCLNFKAQNVGEELTIGCIRANETHQSFLHQLYAIPEVKKFLNEDNESIDNILMPFYEQSPLTREMWVIQIEESKTPIGIINMHSSAKEGNCYELEFALMPEYWNNRYMQYALLFIEHQYSIQPLTLTASVREDNLATKHILSKLGYKKEKDTTICHQNRIHNYEIYTKQIQLPA